MSFRVIHHEGDKDLLFEKVTAIADQLKNKYKDNFDEGKWEHAVDSVAKGDFSDPELASFVLDFTINTSFPPASEDYRASSYLAFADRTSGKLAETLRMFVNGRNFSTGNAGFGYEVKAELGYERSCGYLSPDEVREFLGLLKAYTPDSTVEGDEEFVDYLIDVYSMLVEKNSGDLFIMG